ncbi:carboxypeptidase-like regulatory domain-containing protein [Planotetraspora kaengkrachanensis]|uniref:Uncharacterized protein n=1 Tax=Planotetraspora kaengkrachanensis TaxID=575193 RepID=A0A8J3LZS0_9ACTN|nr:carboxypeptidase-like regulatory domain-containing protein [Planotetraspora kaengkrachanensis]GIG79438.1 hypothetical protein Pka01_25650 [Planotetraspora kaengkrachanensis]
MPEHMPEQWRDDELLAELAMALGADEVPPEFVELGKAMFAWRDIDGELAALIYDSEYDGDRAGALRRDESAPLRALTFSSAEVTFELEIIPDAVLGQVVPCQVLDVHVRVLSGEDVVVTTDDVGCFTIRPIPAGPFSLHCRTETGTRIATGWINI